VSPDALPPLLAGSLPPWDATTPREVRHLVQRPLDASVRTRIAPAPSGELHVGNVRSALYNWALARRHGGTFLLRVEDTDRSRATDEAYVALQGVLHWLGLTWDEGPGIGGPHAPYRQSERLELHRHALQLLLESGAAYRAFDTPEELEAQREAQRAAKQPPRYDGTRWRGLSREESDALAAEGKAFVVRFAVPPGVTTWRDAVRGDVTIDHREIPDFTLARADGHPLYMLAAAVDDALMGLTYVVRGEDLTTATPRQLLLYAALGLPADAWPTFGHLPLLIGDDKKPLSKRNGEVSVAWYRDHGFLPEALVNYLALLGWSLPGDREFFAADEMIAAFSLDRVSKNPARFDIRKLEALNGDWIRGLSTDELAARVEPWLARAVPGPLDVERLQAAVPLVQERLNRLDAVGPQLGFLFTPGPVVVDEAARAKSLLPESLPPLQAAYDVLAALTVWAGEAIEAALRTALVEGLGLKPRLAFAPVRVAVTGSSFSPPLFESLELLGRDETLERLARAIADLSTPE
jgi:glutamyl-tRNA synthetase